MKIERRIFVDLTDEEYEILNRVNWLAYTLKVATENQGINDIYENAKEAHEQLLELHHILFIKYGYDD